MEATQAAEATAAPPPSGEPAAAEPATPTEATPEAAAPAEGAAKGDTLLNGGDLAKPAEAQEATTEAKPADVVPEADKAAETPAEGEDAAKEAVKPDAEAVAKNEKAEEAAKETDDKPKIEGLPDDFDWRDLASDEKNKNRLKQLGSMDEVAEALRDYDSLKRKAVIVPGKDATAEDVAKYHKALGVPASPDGYEVELPKDADPAAVELVERLKGAAHAVHATPAVLNALMQWHAAEAEAVEARDAEALQEQITTVKTELSREWGQDYQRNVGVAQKVADRAFQGYAESFLDLPLPDGSLVRNNAGFVRGMAKLGRLFGEAGVPGQIVPDGWAPTEAELTKMQSEPGYYNGTDKALIERVKRGREMLHGGQ